MKKWRFSVFFTIGLALLFIGSPLLAQNYTVSLKDGAVDWSNGVIEAVGTGFPIRDPINMAQARAAAKGAAVEAARKNLWDIMLGIRVDSSTLIRDLIARSEDLRKAIHGFWQQAHVICVSYRPDGSVEATVSIKLTASFTDLVLPPSIEAIHPIKQPGPPSQEKEEAYTGLVLDCRGIKLSPAMALRVLDEDGNEVYGSSYVSREYATQHGMVGYSKDPTAAQRDRRVGTTPITIKGIRAAGKGLSDVVISNADAARIKRAASNLSFLHKSMVMIVLD